MNKDYPLISFGKPRKAKRRKVPNKRFVPLPQQKVDNRESIAQSLVPQVAKLSSELQSMSIEDRDSVVVKISHEKPVNISGTDLQAIAASETFTLAIPKTENLDKLENKIDKFGTGDLKNGSPPNPQLAFVTAIEQAEPKDRLSDELFCDYEDLIAREWVICEIEIISLLTGKLQRRNELQQIRTDLEQLFAYGINGNLFEHEEIGRTCRIVIRCKGKIFKQLVEDKVWQRKIIWFDPRPAFETFKTTLDNFNVNKLGGFSRPNRNAPIICIIDSGVTIGNPFLKHVVKEDLVTSFLREGRSDPEDKNGHGSGVASLAAYYALNLADGAINEGKVWIASARVLDENNQLEDIEDTPEVGLRLFSNVLTEIVELYAPLGVKIFNLSIGISSQRWNMLSKRTIPRHSWIARTIDRLCRRHDILFVISTGNIERLDVRAFHENSECYPKYFLNEEASILDPSQSSLALTVGSVAPTTLVVGVAARAIAIAEQNLPSPFTRTGPGINKEIKPDIVDFGGNYLLDNGGQVRLNPGTNVVMASHQKSPAIMNSSGTSFAAARGSYKIARILEELQSLRIAISAPLLKAFTINSTSFDFLGNDLNVFKNSLSSAKNKAYLNVLGYGMADSTKATSCNAHSAILYFQGEITPDNVMYFGIPVPACLAESGGIKRLTITVVYAPRVQRWGLEQYLGTNLKWKLFRGNVSRDEIISKMSDEGEDVNENDTYASSDCEEKQDTNNHIEKPKKTGEITKFNFGEKLRSRGTVQHDIYEWKEHLEEYSQSHYTLAIASYARWNKKEEDPLAVVVRIEDTTGTVELHSAIKNSVEIEVEI
jgi:Subtilase family